MALFEIGDQSRAGRLPSEQIARDLCRSGAVKAPEGDVVLETEMDDPVGRRSGVAQGGEVVERSQADLDPSGRQCLSRGMRAGEPDDIVAGTDQFGDKRLDRPSPTLR